MNIPCEEERGYAQNIVDTIREALIVLDENLVVLSASRSFYLQFKTTRDQTEGRLIYDLGNRQWDIPDLRHLLESIIPEQITIEDFEVQHRFESIGEKIMMLNARRVIREQGKPAFILIAIEDITERFRIRELLRESEGQYRKFVEQINSIIIGFDREGKITFFNHFSEKLFGYNRNDVIGKPIFETILPILDSRGQANIPDFNEIFTNPSKYYEKESEATHKDGHRLRISWSAKALRDSAGTITEVLIDGNDITALYRERRAAEENSAMLNALLDSIPEGIMITDSNHVVKRISRSISDLLGVSAERLLNTDELTRLRMLDLYKPGGEKLEKPDDLPLWQTAITGKSFTDMELIVRRDGYQKTIAVSAGPICDNQGTVQGAVGIWRDVSKRKQMTDQLEGERDFINAVIQNSGALITVIDYSGNIIRFNKTCEELTGYTSDEVKGRNVFDLFIPPEEREDVNQVAARLFAGEKMVDFENHWVTKAGEKRYIRWRNSSLSGEKGVAIYAVATGIDITDRRRIEEALRESENRFRGIFNNAAMGMLQTDTGDHFVAVNDYICKLLGYSTEELLAMDVHHLTAPEDRARSDEFNWMIHEKKVNRVAYEKRYLKADGSRLWVNVTVSSIRDDHDAHIGSVTTVEDITERKQNEEALRRSESTLTTIIDALPVGIITADAQGRITRINPATRELWGNTPQPESWEQYGNSIGWWPETGERIKAEEWALARALRTGEVVKNELVRNEKFGTHEQRYYLANAVPLRNDEGQITGGVVAMMDITERREAEEILQQRTSELEATINSIPDGYVIYDPDGNVVRMNTVAQEVLGYTEKEMHLPYAQRIDLFKIETPDGKPFPIERIPSIRAMKGETVRGVIMKIRRPERMYWLSVSAAPMLINENEILGVVMEFVDITSLKRTESALRESEVKFRAIFEQAAIGIGRVSFHDAKWIDVNAAFCSMLDYTKDEFKTTPWTHITHPEDIDSDLIPFKKMAAGELDSYSVEKRFIHKKGHTVWVRLTLSLVRDQQGRPDYEIAIIEDINERKKVEDALRSSEARFRNMFESHGAVMLLIDPENYTIVDANAAAETFYGYSRTELRSMKIQQINQTLPEQVTTEVHKAAQRERNIFEFKHRISSGQVRTVEVYSSPIQVSDKILLFSIIQDISERKSAEEALQHSRQMLSEGEALSHTGAWEWNIVADRWSFSEEWLAIHGVSNNTLKTEELLSVAHPDDRQTITEAIKKLQTGVQTYDLEHRIIRQNDNSVRKVHSRGMFIRDTNGKVVKVYGFAQDITDRKQAEEELRESQERFASAFRTIQDALIISNMETGLIIDVNETWISHWGYSAEQSIGHRTTELGFYTSLSDRDRALEIVQKEGRLANFEILLQTRSGKLRNAILNIEQLTLSRKSLILTTIHDITERKQAEIALLRRSEELAAANRELESFSYSVSHDLRNPLHTIGSFAVYLLEDYADRLDEEGQDYLRRINDGVKKMQSLIDDMLSLSRIGRSEMNRENINLSAIVQNYLQELKGMHPERLADFIIQDNVIVSADPRLVHLALENLLRNAWKFTSKKDITRIEFGTITKENQTIFFIRDNGEGFDMKFAEKIFEPFKRVHAEKEFGGTGVGLSIVQRVVNRHGGRIWVEGKVGKGAVFYFTLG